MKQSKTFRSGQFEEKKTYLNNFLGFPKFVNYCATQFQLLKSRVIQVQQL